MSTKFQEILLKLVNFTKFNDFPRFSQFAWCWPPAPAADGRRPPPAAADGGLRWPTAAIRRLSIAGGSREPPRGGRTPAALSRGGGGRGEGAGSRATCASSRPHPPPIPPIPPPSFLSPLGGLFGIYLNSPI